MTIFLINSASSVPQSEQHLPPVSRFAQCQRQSDKPTLGTTFTYLTDCTLWCTSAEAIWAASGQQKYLVEVIRNRSGPVGEWTVYELVRDEARNAFILANSFCRRTMSTCRYLNKCCNANV